MSDTTRRRLHGWGRTAPSVAEVATPRSEDEVGELVTRVRGRHVIARGLGRSYGDAAQSAGGLVVDLTGLDAVLSIDTEAATVTVEAGISLEALMRTLLPHGLWIPVLPGTRQVTVGGAIGADVHGKNHHVAGSFGQHVRSLRLVTADGAVHELTPDGPGSDLFWATVGGMGLTGIITRATLALSRVESAYFLVDTDRTADLDDLLRLLSREDQHPYSVAWFDSIAQGRRLGRAVLTRGRSARADELPDPLRADPLRFAAPALGTVPDVFPFGLVNRLTGRLFNEAWFRKAPAHRRHEVQDITTFFHPLDVVGDWNRVYGRRGLCQYQFVVPMAAADALRESVRVIAESGHVSCLNVLKRFGEGDRGLLSFPMAGWTLAVDLPQRPGLGPLLDRLDDLVLDAGGRVYLAKDSRLSAATFARMYPRLDEFREIVSRHDPDRLFASDLSRRLAL